jgi:hypothetical protein
MACGISGADLSKIIISDDESLPSWKRVTGMN